MDRRKLIARITLVLSTVLSLALLADNPLFEGKISTFLSPETFKTLLQFVLVTLGGGIVFLYLNIVKDEEERQEKENSLKRDLIGELDRLYRDAKHVRRTLQSYCEYLGDINNNDHNEPYRITIGRKLCEDKLDKLDEIQISVEGFCTKFR